MMKRSTSRIEKSVLIALALVLFFQASDAVAQEATALAVPDRYTAQRKPRVTVLDFSDTNSEAQGARYGASIQAMLVTFLKRKSQFVVVERQKLGEVLQEWQRNQRGLTNLRPADPTASELLEKIDGIVMGNVTLLNQVAEATVTHRSGAAPPAPAQPSASPPDAAHPPEEAAARDRVQGQKIEIDVKLLSRADGRIIAAAQRSGPVSCLRSIVERLGIALEQEFLRPYYGKVKINLTEPENVRIFLTPILLDTALDEEKPPAERNSTVIQGGDRDLVEVWATDPTSYTIESLLSGWYSMRLERPGYEGLGTDYTHWQARELGDQMQIYGLKLGQALQEIEPGLRRFVVHVDPLKTEVIDGDALGFRFRKKSGSLDPRVKRQYLDADYSIRPDRVILIGKRGIEINSSTTLHEYADDAACDLFEERSPRPPDYGRTYIASGQEFDFSTFKGGELIFDNYQGETLPVGQYQMTLWEPGYQLLTTEVNVRDRDQSKTTRGALVRNTEKLQVTTTGALAARRLTLAGKDTRFRLELPLDFDTSKVLDGLPVDTYAAATDIPTLQGWRKEVEVKRNEGPPIYDPKSKDSPPLRSSAEQSGKVKRAALRVKTRLTMGGRLEALAKPPDPTAGKIYVDPTIRPLLDRLLGREVERHEDSLFDAFKQALLESIPLPRPRSTPAPPPPATSLPAATGKRSNAPAEATAAEAQEPENSGPDAILRDPEALRSFLAERLDDLDLLVLDQQDMKQLRRSPETAALVQRFVDHGGALFAFATDEGEYGGVLGGKLYLTAKDKDTNRFDIQTGELPELRLELRERRVKVKSKRDLPQLKNWTGDGGWRVVAYGRGRKEPRIVEHGSRDQGGYVAVWLDDPGSFRNSQGGTVPDVEAVRDKVEAHVFDWARTLMQRRYGTAAAQQTAEKSPR
jgi:curli biogenesis system outer membrane secretion channel CsgG